MKTRRAADSYSGTGYFRAPGKPDTRVTYAVAGYINEVDGVTVSRGYDATVLPQRSVDIFALVGVQGVLVFDDGSEIDGWLSSSEGDFACTGAVRTP